MTKQKQCESMYAEYLKGFSLAEVGKMFGITRQSVYDSFKRRNYKLRTKKTLPFLSFDNKKFTLCNNGYYRQTDGNRELMHRYVWIYYNGEIPKGFDIHHKNHNKSDNNIKNLELICHKEHAKKFNTGNNQFKKTKELKNGKYRKII